MRPSKQPVNGDVPNPHYVYLSAVQQFLCEVHGRAFAVANAGPALATIGELRMAPQLGLPLLMSSQRPSLP